MMNFSNLSSQVTVIPTIYVLLSLLLTSVYGGQVDAQCISITDSFQFPSNNYACPIAPIPGPIPLCTIIAFSPDGSYLAFVSGSAHVDSVVIIFRVAANGKLSGGTPYFLPSPSDSPNPTALAISPNGLYLAVASYVPNEIILFSIGAEGKLSEATTYNVSSGAGFSTSLGFSSSYLITSNNVDFGYTDESIVIFQVESDGVLSGAKSYVLPGDSCCPNSTAVSPNGAYVATANGSNDVTIFQVGPGGTLNEGVSYKLPIGASGPILAVFSPDGLYLAVANYLTDNITIFKVGIGGILSQGTSYSLPKEASGVSSIAFSPNGKYLIATNQQSKSITVFEADPDGILNQGVSYALPRGASAPVAVTFSPNGLYFATANCYDNPGITVFKVENSCGSDGTKVPLALIMGPIVGIGVSAFIVAAILIGCYVLYKRGSLNLSTPLSAAAQSYGTYSSVSGESQNPGGTMPGSAYYQGSDQTIGSEESAKS